ncbi:Hypothetical predicted protein [Pelobates cultripes]|uniref:exodeoxyribonuclease III n=1 Tax=Pelobates cultripes TaxID=61616 RepID=A0AAD1S9R1_PELCU|nr:Hypothetical predicted protein [Pelobates cultripes]
MNAPCSSSRLIIVYIRITVESDSASPPVNNREVPTGRRRHLRSLVPTKCIECIVGERYYPSGCQTPPLLGSRRRMLTDSDTSLDDTPNRLCDSTQPLHTTPLELPPQTHLTSPSISPPLFLPYSTPRHLDTMGPPPLAPHTPGHAEIGINLYTINVKGLNSPQKRARALREIRALKISIAFFQETHFLATKAPKFSDKYFPTGYYAHNPSTKSKGVAILFSADTQFRLEAEEKDREGRYLFLKGHIGDAQITLANLYLPNKGQKSFLASALRKLEAFSAGTVIIGGDLNAPLDPKMDTSKGGSTIPDHVLRGLRTLLTTHQLVDCWDLDTLCSAHIAPMTWSDHAPVTLTIDNPRTFRSQWTWKLNESLLEDPLIQTEIRNTLDHFFPTNQTTESAPTTVWEAHKCTIRGILIKHGTRLKKTTHTGNSTPCCPTGASRNASQTRPPRRNLQTTPRDQSETQLLPHVQNTIPQRASDNTTPPYTAYLPTPHAHTKEKRLTQRGKKHISNRISPQR